MKLSRRCFFGGAVTIAGATLLPSLPSGLPKIYGDMVHDDYEGLQALLYGKPFEIEGKGIIAKKGYLSGGTFYISKPIRFRLEQGEQFHLKNCSITMKRYASKDEFYAEIGRGGGYINIDVG